MTRAICLIVFVASSIAITRICGLDIYGWKYWAVVALIGLVYGAGWVRGETSEPEDRDYVI